MANPVDILIGKKAIEDFDVLITKTIKAQEEILKLGNDALIASKSIGKINSPSGVNANSTQANTITASLNKQTEALAKTQAQVDRLRLAEIKLQQDREKAFDSYDKKIKKQIQLEEKASQKAIAESNKIIAQKEREFAKFEQEFNRYEADLAKKSIAEEKAKKIAVQSALDQSKAFQGLQAQKERALSTEAKQQQVLARSETAYQRIQSSVTLLSKTYQDLAIRRELGGTLTKREEAQLVSLTNRLNMYQTALKKVDADIQKNQRNVGNYASGWNGLGNSINQITRELPAFTFSAQTGILALSNNIPILTDEIGKLQRANAELIKQGKPVKSVFSQILGAFISLQTAMGVGILLLTLYGKEIGAFITKMFSFEKTLTAGAIAQKAMTEASKEGVKSAQDELVQLKLNLGIAQDVTKSYEQRKLAVDTLKETYPDYLKNISDEAILSGKAEEAINLLTIAIINNAKAQAAKTRILENETKRLDLLDEEVRLNQELIEQDKQNVKLEQRMKDEVKIVSDRNTALTRYNDGTAKSIFLRSRLAENTAELNKLDEVNNQLSDYAIKNATLFNTKNDEKKKKEKEAKRDKIEDLKIEARATNSLLDSLEQQIRLIKELQNAMARSSSGWNEYQKVIDKLQYGIDVIKKGNEELYKTAEKGIDAAKKEEQIRLDQIKRMQELKKATDEYIKSFSDSFLGSIGLSSLDQFFDGTFTKLMAGADTMQAKFAVTFLAITEVAKQAFAFINQASQQNFEAEYSRLEMQKEVAIKFAGESTTAQEAINEEYDRRRKEIQRREAESKKDLAIFNSLINTAQGVTSALASANIPLAIVIGALGAIQTGFIASQEIPRFFEGGTHKGGLMLVNDGKGSNYKETIVTPDGKVINPSGRNVLMDAPKGTQIFNSSQSKERDEYLRSFLQSKGISMSYAPKESTLNVNEFNSGISRLERTLNSSSKGSLSIDKRGIELWKQENGRKTRVLNNRLNVR